MRRLPRFARKRSSLADVGRSAHSWPLGVASYSIFGGGHKDEAIFAVDASIKVPIPEKKRFQKFLADILKRNGFRNGIVGAGIACALTRWGAEGMSIRNITLLYNPIVSILADGEEHSAWDIEDELARLFNVTERERAILHPDL